MIWLIVAQAARLASLWVASAMYRRILKSIALASVGFYLAERVQKQREIDERRIAAYEKSNRIER
jgi:hypothetical protein